MARHGYHECDWGEELSMGRWQGIIASATRGKRGQRFFVELVEALDAMSEKALAEGALETADGGVCALGALCRHKGIDASSLDTEDWATLGSLFDVAEQLTQEVMYENDESGRTPEERWCRVRAWALAQIRPETLIGEPEAAE